MFFSRASEADQDRRGRTLRIHDEVNEERKNKKNY